MRGCRDINAINVSLKAATYSPGGCALNTCRVFSWLNQDGGAEATFVGAAGNDDSKRRLEVALKKEGLTAK